MLNVLIVVNLPTNFQEMKLYTTIFFLTALMLRTYAQPKLHQSSWQQHVDYYLDVKLDDVKHTLDGNARYSYTNNSPQTLKELYFHLWPNAYKNNTTDFAMQQLANRSKKFYFADEDERGHIDGLNFEVNGKSISWHYYADYQDICVLVLNEGIEPGETVEIETPFKVKIPGSFSRMGHVEQSYQITQWYPKPAVYDVNGWNQMPYLDQGEFYSEYGKFEVRITVPSNYVVAATGEVQEEAEKEFLRNRIDNPYTADSVPASAESTKTITYIQDNIHDFAWFADKTFNVRETEVVLSNGQVVNTYVYAPGKDLSYNRYIGSALNYYSEHCGYYPYKNCSVVKGALKAGGGMEYPMITVVSELSEEVIVHEVGHNWFYGILGSNERRYPWMDESINSYFEHETVSKRRPTEIVTLENKSILKDGGINSTVMSLGARQMERIEYHQPIGQSSELFNYINYGLMVYGKGADAFTYLKEYLGQDVTDACFKAYFDKWKFRHPLPKDMQQIFESVSARNLNWFFDGVLNTSGHIDYKMKSIDDGSLIVENVGDIEAPYSIGFFSNGKMTKEIWVQGHTADKEIITAGIVYDVAKIDPREVMPEVNRQNNSIRSSGMAKRIEPIDVKLFSILNNPNRTTLNMTPIVGYNIHNKFMLGLWVNNVQVPSKGLTFSATPLFSPTTNDLNGYFNVNYEKYRDSRLDAVKFGVKGSRFAFENADRSYNRLVPFVKFHFRTADKRMSRTSSILLRSVLISNQTNFNLKQQIEGLALDSGFALGRRKVLEDLPDQFYEFVYQTTNAKTLNPSSMKVKFQLGVPHSATHQFDTASKQLMEMRSSDMFAKLNVELKKRIDYSLPKKGFDVRVFGGIFLDQTDEGLYHYRMESGAGKWDYTYDEVLMGRGATDGLFSRQVIENDVFIKDQGSFINMDKWALAVNLKSDIPLKLPLGVYLDAFTFKDIKNAPNVKEGESFIYSGGLMVKVIPKVLEVYVPLFSSTMISEAQSLQGIENLGQRISFMLNFNVFKNFDIHDGSKLAGR